MAGRPTTPIPEAIWQEWLPKYLEGMPKGAISQETKISRYAWTRELKKIGVHRDHEQAREVKAKLKTSTNVHQQQHEDNKLRSWLDELPTSGWKGWDFGKSAEMLRMKL